MYAQLFVPGTRTLIDGCMFAGKTNRAVLIFQAAEVKGLNMQLFKPRIDSRYSTTAITAHNGVSVESTLVDTAAQIFAAVSPDTQLVGIDEAQFFDPDLPLVVRQLSSQGIITVVAGLDRNFRDEPFGPMPQLLAAAHVHISLSAICTVCGGDAYCTQRLIDGSPALYDSTEILVGAAESYEARCHLHHEVPGRPVIYVLP